MASFDIFAQPSTSRETLFEKYLRERVSIIEEERRVAREEVERQRATYVEEERRETMDERWMVQSTRMGVGGHILQYVYNTIDFTPKGDMINYPIPSVLEWGRRVFQALTENPTATQFIFKIRYPNNRTQDICPPMGDLKSLGFDAFINLLVLNLQQTLEVMYQDTPEADYDYITAEAAQAELITTSFQLIFNPKTTFNFGSVGVTNALKTFRRGNVMTISYLSHGDNCFPVILKACLNTKKQARTIRKELDLPLTGKIELNPELFEKVRDVYNLKIDLYDSYDGLAIPRYLTDIDDVLPIMTVRILHIGDHVELITQFLDEKKEIKEGVEPEIILAYDFETVYGDDGIMKPWSVQWMVSSMKGVTIQTPQYLFTPDLNADKTMVEVIIYWMSRCREVVLLGYNNSRFDDLILLPSLVSRIRVNPFFASGSLLKLRIGNNCHTLDLCRHLCLPLATAATAFKCKQGKEKLSHSNVQNAFIHGNLIDFYFQNKEEIEKYGKADVACLMELYFKYAEEMNKLIPGYHKVSSDPDTFRKSEIRDFMTASQIAESLFQDMNTQIDGKPKFDLKKFKNLTQQHEFKKFTIAGRSDVFKTGITPEAVNTLDVISQYPRAMKDGQFVEECEPEEVYKFEKGAIGLYNVRILSQPPHGVVPFRTKNGYDWHYKEKFTAAVMSPTLEVLLEEGGDFEVIDGRIYRNTSFGVFTQYVKLLYNKKRQQDTLKAKASIEYNPALRNIVKLLLNSLSGKKIQRSFLTETRLLRNPLELSKMERECNDINLIPIRGMVIATGVLKKPKVSSQSHINGALIYENARCSMCRDIYSKVEPEELVYTETDSCCILRSAFTKYKQTNEHLINQDRVDKDIGKFTDETEELVEEYFLKQGLTDMPKELFSRQSPIKLAPDGIIWAYRGDDYVPTEYYGPRAVVIGKKCHAYFLENRRINEYIGLKCKFKGVKVSCNAGCDPKTCEHVAKVISLDLYEAIKQGTLTSWQAFLLFQGYKYMGEKRAAGFVDKGDETMIYNRITDELEPISIHLESFQLKHYFELLEKGSLHVITNQIQRAIIRDGLACGVKAKFITKKLKRDDTIGIFIEQEYKINKFLKDYGKKGPLREADNTLISCKADLSLFDNSLEDIPSTTQTGLKQVSQNIFRKQRAIIYKGRKHLDLTLEESLKKIIQHQRALGITNIPILERYKQACLTKGEIQPICKWLGFNQSGTLVSYINSLQLKDIEML